MMFSNSTEISKALGDKGQGFEMMDILPLIDEPNLRKPQLLTVLMGGGNLTNRVYNETNSFRYDMKDFKPQLFGSKPYHERGPVLTQDRARNIYFDIPSLGAVTNIKPSDYRNQRMPGTNRLKQVEDVIAELNAKAIVANDLTREMEYATLLTAGTNYVNQGYFDQYDYSLAITGSSRAAATDVDFATDPSTVTQAVRTVKDRAAAWGRTVSRVYIVAGDEFFQEAFEWQQLEGFFREIRGNVDLMSQQVPEMLAGDYSYENFYAPTLGAVTFVRYNAEINGTALIGSKDAYVLPVLADAPMVLEVFAPANTIDAANKTAQDLYAWTRTDNFSGVVTMYETNRLPLLPRPDLIVKLTLDDGE